MLKEVRNFKEQKSFQGKLNEQLGQFALRAQPIEEQSPLEFIQQQQIA